MQNKKVFKRDGISENWKFILEKDFNIAVQLDIKNIRKMEFKSKINCNIKKEKSKQTRVTAT